MGAMVAKPNEQPQNSNGVLPLLGQARRLQPANNSGVNQLWFHGCVIRALKRITSQKDAAFQLGMDKGNYSRVCDGQGGLDVRKLGVFGDEFGLALIDELRIALNVDTDAHRLARAIEARAACDRVIEEIARKGLR